MILHNELNNGHRSTTISWHGATIQHGFYILLVTHSTNISQALLNQAGNDANKIFGTPDDLKLKSSMTLFASLKETNPVFQMVLDKFFNGKHDDKTIEIIKP